MEKAYFAKRAILPEADSAFLLADPTCNRHIIVAADHPCQIAFMRLQRVLYGARKMGIFANWRF
jgi:hypothetical protein